MFHSLWIKILFMIFSMMVFLISDMGSYKPNDLCSIAASKLVFRTASNNSTFSTYSQAPLYVLEILSWALEAFNKPTTPEQISVSENSGYYYSSANKEPHSFIHLNNFWCYLAPLSFHDANAIAEGTTNICFEFKIIINK